MRSAYVELIVINLFRLRLRRTRHKCELGLA